jgi:hypothetical protein
MQVLTVATLAARNAKEAVVARMVGLRLLGVWSQAVGFMLVRLTGIWLHSQRRCFHISLVYKELLQMYF